MSLAKCPKCGYRRYDTWAEACERRQCGYEKPRPPEPPVVTPRGVPEPDR